MTIRIPGRVNLALDAAQRHPRLLLAVGCGVAVAWPVALLWASPYAAIITACILLIYVVAAAFKVREARLREEIRQLVYDLAAERATVARLRAGDPSAPTVQLHSIGDGERP